MVPEDGRKLSKRELEMASQLIESLSTDFDAGEVPRRVPRGAGGPDRAQGTGRGGRRGRLRGAEADQGARPDGGARGEPGRDQGRAARRRLEARRRQARRRRSGAKPTTAASPAPAPRAEIEDREARPKPRSRRRRAPARAHQPRQGAVARERLHQGPGDRLLRASRRRDPPPPPRPAADPEALSERRRRELLLREALPVAPARLGRDRPGVERPQRGRHRLLPVQRPRHLDLDGTAGRARAPSIALAGRGDRAPDRARLRPRPRRAGGHPRLLPGRASPARAVRRARPRVLPEDLGVEGAPGLPAAERRGHLRADEALRPCRRPGARARRARPGRLADGEEAAQGEGVRRLEPERPRQDDGRRLLAAGARAADRLDPARMGGGRGRRRATKTRRRSASRRPRCSSEWKQRGDLFAPVLELEQELPDDLGKAA